jgi:type VI protein secretion system component Hcp
MAFDIFLKIKLTDILIPSYITDGTSNADVPTDQISLNFTKIDFLYSTGNEETSGEAGR